MAGEKTFDSTFEDMNSIFGKPDVPKSPKEDSASLDELLNRRLKETESATRKQFGPSREERLENIEREKRRKEDEVRERKRKEDEEREQLRLKEEDVRKKSYREMLEKAERGASKEAILEERLLLSKLDRYKGVVEVMNVVNTGNTIRINIDLVENSKHSYLEDIASSMRTCILVVDFRRKSSKDLPVYYLGDIGTKLAGGFISIDKISGGSIGREMSAGTISVRRDYHFYHLSHASIIGTRMKGGKIEFGSDLEIWKDIGMGMEDGEIEIKGYITGSNTPQHTRIGYKMEGGTIRVGGNLRNCFVIGTNMSNGNIIIDGEYGHGYSEIYSRYVNLNTDDISRQISIGRNMSGGSIIIRGNVFAFRSTLSIGDYDKKFIPFPLERIGENMTGGTIILEKYLFSKGWFRPKVYSRRLVIER